MSVRYAILGLLMEQPMHGYRLKKVIDERLGPFWGLTTGQIYQSLSAMERSVLIESRTERRRHRPSRRVYTVMPAGRRMLATWLGRPPARVSRAAREEAIVRMMLLDGTRAPDFDHWLEGESNKVENLLSRLRTMHATPHAAANMTLAVIHIRSLEYQLEARLKSLQLFRAEIAREHLPRATSQPLG